MLFDAICNAALIASLDQESRSKNETAQKYIKRMLNSLKKDGVDTNFVKLGNMSFREFIDSNANEAMSTDQTGFGKEFVESEILDRVLIDRIEDPNSLIALFASKTMLAEKVRFPVRGAKIRMIGGTEQKDVPGEVPGTSKAQLKKANTAELIGQAKKLILTVFWSYELEEDSVIAIGNYVLNELASAYETSLHEVLLNGDTRVGANVNINIIDGNTTALADGDRTDFIAINNGARRYALDNSGQGFVDAGVLDLSDIRAARKVMGIKGANPRDLVMAVDYQTYQELLGLDEVTTYEKFGDAATVVNGVLTMIDGIRIVTREELGLTTATGEISATPASNDKGQIVILHVPSFMWGFRRTFGTELDQDTVNQQRFLTASTRIDLVVNNIQNNKDATLPSAVIGNITV